MVLLDVVYMSMNRIKSYESVTPKLMEDSDVALSYVGISQKRKGWCSIAVVGISLRYETKVIEPVGEPSNTT